MKNGAHVDVLNFEILQKIALHLIPYGAVITDTRVKYDPIDFDLIESGIDVAIRTRESETDSGLVIRRLAETHRALAASPEYLAQYGTPQSPEDLKGHRFLARLFPCPRDKVSRSAAFSPASGEL
jgi:DNA-binding transcriptional LysR family regulator